MALVLVLRPCLRCWVTDNGQTRKSRGEDTKNVNISGTIGLIYFKLGQCIHEGVPTTMWHHFCSSDITGCIWVHKMYPRYIFWQKGKERYNLECSQVCPEVFPSVQYMYTVHIHNSSLLVKNRSSIVHRKQEFLERQEVIAQSVATMMYYEDTSRLTCNTFIIKYWNIFTASILYATQMTCAKETWELIYICTAKS